MTSVVFSARNDKAELKPLFITDNTTVKDLAKAGEVFTVFADSSQQAIDTAKLVNGKVRFKGDFQLGDAPGKDGNTRYLCRVWKSAPMSTDASSLLGIIDPETEDVGDDDDDDLF